MPSRRCNICSCPVEHANWEEHVRAWPHRFKVNNTKSTWCDVCGCPVPRCGLREHEEGEIHRDEGIRTDRAYPATFNSSRGGFFNDATSLTLDPSDIFYSQGSIGNSFQDGTTLADGIDNLLRSNGEYLIEVDRLPSGIYVALNNRTLYCYKEAGFGQVTVTVNRGELQRRGRKAYGRNIKVRGF